MIPPRFAARIKVFGKRHASSFNFLALRRLTVRSGIREAGSFIQLGQDAGPMVTPSPCFGLRPPQTDAWPSPCYGSPDLSSLPFGVPFTTGWDGGKSKGHATPSSMTMRGQLRL